LEGSPEKKTTPGESGVGSNAGPICICNPQKYVERHGWRAKVPPTHFLLFATHAIICTIMGYGSLFGASLAVMAGLGTLAIHSSVQAQTASSEFEGVFDQAERPTIPLEPEKGAVDLRAIEPTMESDAPTLRNLGSGTASYYGRRFHGRLTASGETFDMHALTAAHPSLPFGSLVRVTNPRNGRSVVVRINDRGPFVGDRVIDLSRAAAKEIGLIRRGHAEVELELVES
jgi:rare lipoprotein A